MTSLLRMRTSSKTSAPQLHNIRTSAATHKQVDTSNAAESSQSGLYDAEQVKLSVGQNYFLTKGRKNHAFYMPDDSLQPQSNFNSIAVYGRSNLCACLACRTKTIEASKTKQELRAETIMIVNEASTFGKQQHTIKNQFQPEFTHTTNLSATQNRHGNHHELIPARKQARLSTAARNFNLQPPLTRATTQKVAYNNIYQQNVKFQPHFISNQDVDIHTKQSAMATVNRQHRFDCLFFVDKNIDFQHRCFPGWYYRCNPFQESLGSLTSSIDSVDSDTNRIVTSRQSGKTCVTSSQLQVIDNSDSYNFVYH